MSNFALLSARRSEASASLRAESAGRAGLAAQPLLPFGFEVMSIEVKNVVNGSALTTTGLIVISVLPGSTAQQAGLRPGDMIETIDGRGQLGLDWREQLPREMGQGATLGVLREGKRLTVNLKRPER
jgi:C-terminal processing protease CtpA/Prc